LKHTLPENSSHLTEPEEEALALPFKEGAEMAGSEAPPPELAGNSRYRVLPEFYSQALGNSRCIRVYLPEAYLRETQRRFPVFYLHDGQNLFDARTSYVVNHTWRAHATADHLTRKGEIEPAILVGIDNTGVGRMAEYTPTRDVRMGGGDGSQYGELIVEELMPLINRELRTLTGPEHTGVGGSSLGGLISLFLGLDRPDVFGKLAVLSPSVWWNQRAVLSLIRAAKPKPRIWLDMGTAEGLRHLRDCDLLHYRLVQKGWKDRVDLRYLRVAGGLHNEDAWAARFDQVLKFLFPPKAAK
jgi:predicted alpha/beta superfamily hydrolase